MIDHIARLDAENRETVFEMALCDPYAGHLARLYLQDFPAVVRGGSPDEALLDVIHWLILAREACGLQGVGHA